MEIKPLRPGAGLLTSCDPVSAFGGCFHEEPGLASPALHPPPRAPLPPAPPVGRRPGGGGVRGKCGLL